MTNVLNYIQQRNLNTPFFNSILIILLTHKVEKLVSIAICVWKGKPHFKQECSNHHPLLCHGRMLEPWDGEKREIQYNTEYSKDLCTSHHVQQIIFTETKHEPWLQCFKMLPEYLWLTPIRTSRLPFFKILSRVLPGK